VRFRRVETGLGQASMDILDELLSGAKNSVIEMVLEDATTKEFYGFFAQCHVPLSLEKRNVQRYHIKDDVQVEQGLLVDPSIVEVLQELREGLSNPPGSIKDVMNFGIRSQTSLGIRVAFRWSGSYVSSGIIEDVVPGSTADPVLKIGDEIISGKPFVLSP
jgi:hypothetical protein